ncbi:type II toxin-antitoxin system HicB family antitoxin [uncultured Desulfosarcina sp.]|uniref:type II toxin-antitoxin system HicB family antitoxin n=1 Tax=uncultured Desulfosarcina sp. TaxID=218289 RepID=UPI0029C95272|nr:type II toxin-antitoxin system HicB family antitoxin [uncultured Desulfosarcina sp.]
MPKVQVKMQLRIPVEIHKKDKWYVASCPVLDVITQGKTENSAKKNLGDALELFLTTCFEMGTLDEVLKKCGFELRPAKKSSKSERFVQVPPKDYLDGLVSI